MYTMYKLILFNLYIVYKSKNAQKNHTFSFKTYFVFKWTIYYFMIFSEFHYYFIQYYVSWSWLLENKTKPIKVLYYSNMRPKYG